MRLSKIILFQLFLMAFILINCSQDSNPIQPNLQNMDNDFLIYSLVIDSLLFVPGREWMVFLDSTETWAFHPEDTTYFPNLQQNTIDNYNFCNQNSSPFKINIDKSLSSDFISWKKWESLGGWEGFYQTYPNSHGLVGFSKIGYNTTANQAMVCVSWYVHYLAGGGYIIILSRGENWQIDQMEIIWIS